MKRRLTMFVCAMLVIFSVPANLNSQEDKLLQSCEKYLKSPFVITGQPLKAFLTGEEVAEFHATLFEGNIYRIVACSHEPDNITFSVYDSDRNLLFSNNSYADANYWDFKMEGSIECIIEAKLSSPKTSSGIALLMMGFKYTQN
ncbi:MAG: hypothetical protein QM786_12600 [Breznakibacter sp.]